MNLYGYIFNSDDKQRVQFATVQVFVNGFLKRSAVADSGGNFQIEAEPGSEVRFSQAEYITRSFSANWINEAMDVLEWAAISLTPKNTLIRPVVVHSGGKKNKNWLWLAAIAGLFFINKKN